MWCAAAYHALRHIGSADGATHFSDDEIALLERKIGALSAVKQPDVSELAPAKKDARGRRSSMRPLPWSAHGGSDGASTPSVLSIGPSACAALNKTIDPKACDAFKEAAAAAAAGLESELKL